MKPRRITLLLEVETDLPLPFLKHMREIGVDVKGHLKRIQVHQSQPNVIRTSKKPKRIVRIHQ